MNKNEIETAINQINTTQTALSGKINYTTKKANIDK